MLKRSKAITIICSVMFGLVFALATLIVMTVSGFGQNTLVIETESFEAKYDGTPITNYTWKITEGKLKKGHTVGKVNFTGTQTNVGESKNIVEIVIHDELGTDVTSDYKIQYNYGTLKVNPRTIAVSTPSATKAYDGMPLTKLEYNVAEDFDGVAIGHFVVAKVTGYQIEIGESANTMSEVKIYDFVGADVTGNYQIVMREGTLLVYSPDAPPAGSNGPDNFGGGGLGGVDPQTVLYQVYSDRKAKIYLKEASYGNYNGKGFDAATAYEKLIEDEFSAMYVSSLALEANGAPQYELKIKAFYEQYVIPYYLSPMPPIHAIQKSDTVAEGDTSEEWTVSYYDAPTSVLSLPSLYATYELDYRKFVHDNYLAVDDVTRTFFEAIVLSEDFSSLNILETIDKVAKYIQSSATYNLEYDTNLDNESNVALAFLADIKREFAVITLWQQLCCTEVWVFPQDIP